MLLVTLLTAQDLYNDILGLKSIIELSLNLVSDAAYAFNCLLQNDI